MTKSHHHFADFLLLIIALIIFLVVLVASPIGSQTLASIANVAGLGLKIEGVKGTVLDGLEIKSFQWQGKKTRIELLNVKLKLVERPYKKDRLKIKRLSASDLNIYVTRTGKKSNKPIRVPGFPIPLNLQAELVRLDRLKVIPVNPQENTVSNKIWFRLAAAEVKDVTIINNQLSAKTVSAKPLIAGYPMGVWLNNYKLNFNLPHQMSGEGRLKYSHVQTGQFEGPVTVGGTLTDYTVEGDIHWRERYLGLGESQVHIKGYGDYRKAIISSALLQNDKGDLDITGNIAWMRAFSWQGHVKGRNVDTRRWMPRWPITAEVDMDTSGSYVYADDLWQIDLDFNSVEGDVDDYPLDASGLIRLKDHILSVHDVRIDTTDNRILLDGRITDPFRLEWDADIKQVEQVLPGYQGSVSGKGVAQGTIGEPAGSGVLRVRDFSGEGVAVASADLQVDASSNNGKLAAKIKGQVRQLHYEDISVVSAVVEFDGRKQKARLEGKGVLRMRQLKSPALELAKADLQFDGSTQALNIKGLAQQLSVAGQHFNRAEVEARGMFENHQITMSATGGQAAIEGNIKGGWFEDHWRGVVTKLEVKKTATGDWMLKKPVSVKVSAKAFSASEICVSNPKRGSMCTDTRWSVAEGLISKGSLIQLLLTQVKPWLPEYMGLDGVVNGKYDVRFQQRKLSGTARFLLADDEIEIQTAAGKKEILPYRNGSITLKFKGNKVETHTELELAKRGKLVSDTNITLDTVNKRHRIHGETRFNIAKMDWVQEWVPDIALPKGQLTSVIRYDGPLNNPGYSGEIILKNGSFEVPDAGASINRINLQIKTGRPNQAGISGSVYIGRGRLDASGNMVIKGLNDWTAELNLQGERLNFINTHEVQAMATPDVKFNITPSAVRIDGRLLIPSARIKLAELPETAIYESGDIVFAGTQNNADKEKPMRILPNVTIVLGNSIFFEGFGLKTKLGGEFHVSHNKNDIVSRGTLKVIEGQYRAYGQRLDIEHGVLVFNGPIGNPGLDISATRTVDDIKVGLNLAGTLQDPESTVFSDPPQPESDALSYLITGQRLSETSGDQAQILVQAVRTLGISSGSSVLNRVGGSVGLDDINIITYADYKKNKIQLGKRLGAKLYIRYITGLFDTFHKIAVDYKIGSKWILQAESGEDQGVDFIYEINR